MKRSDLTHARWPLLAGVAAATLVVDQAAKAAAVSLLAAEQSRPILGRWLHLTLQRNPGGAFGFLPQGTVMLTIVSAAVALLLVLYAKHAMAHSALLTAAVGLLLGGAVGNLSDRVRLGHVVDFIDLRVWPVFNVADMGVTVGAGLIVLALLRRPREPA